MIDKTFIRKMLQLAIWEQTPNVIIRSVVEFINRLDNSNMLKDNLCISGDSMFLIDLLKSVLNIRLSMNYYDYNSLINSIKGGKFEYCIDILDDMYKSMDKEKILSYENELATKMLMFNFKDNIDEIDNLVKTFKNKNFSSQTEFIECLKYTLSKINSALSMCPVDRLIQLKELSIIESDLTVMANEFIENVGNKNVISTGLPFIDDNLTLNGLEPNRLYLIAGTSGVGKSMFLLNFAVNAIKNNAKSDKKSIYLYISGENLVNETFDRLYCSFFRIPYSSFMNELKRIYQTSGEKGVKKYYESIDNKIKKCFSESNADLLIYYFPPHVTSVYDIKEYIKSVSEIGEIKCVYIDYMDLMNGGRKYSEFRFELATVAQELKNLAVELGIPVVTATQLNREGYISDEAKPVQISESIEKINKSDCVIYIQSYRKGDDKVEIGGTIYKRVKVSIVKQRNGISSISCDMYYRLYNSYGNRENLFDFVVYDLENTGTVVLNKKNDEDVIYDSSSDW